MNLVSAADFLSWAADRRIEPDARYAEPRCLTYVPHQNHARFWLCPEKPARLPAFLDSLLTGLDTWSHCYVWPRRGCWPYSSTSQEPGEAVAGVLLNGAGVPNEYAGAACFQAGEMGRVLALLYASLAFGWSVADDLFVIPDHGRQFLQTDHRGVVHVCFAVAGRVQGYDEHMAADGFLLPNDLPDETFKRSEWMDRKEES